jgi:hypothetical protein
MLNRQFGLLLIATLLLSPHLVSANESETDRDLSVGTVQIRNTSSGTTLQTPNIQIDTPKTPVESRVNSRARRRVRTATIRRPYASTPAMIRQQVKVNSQSTVMNSSSYSTTAPIQNSTVRSSTIHNSSNGSQTVVNDRQQWTQCHGGGSSTSQSTTMVNGRTVSSESRSNCN